MIQLQIELGFKTMKQAKHVQNITRLDKTRSVQGEFVKLLKVDENLSRAKNAACARVAHKGK